MPEDLLFTLFYFIFSICIIYPPIEFVSAGFTIESIFSKFLKSEQEDFIFYHIKRSIITVIIFTWLPLGYISILFLTGSSDNVKALYLSKNLFWQCFMTTSLILPLMGALIVRVWMRNNYSYHPIVINLNKYCTNSNRSWERVASDINREYRSVFNILIQTNAITKVIATENWILKVSPFTIQITYQSDAKLTVKEAHTHDISLQSTTQFLNIEVTSSRRNVSTFWIRINAADFKDLQERLVRTIVIPPNVKFHTSTVDLFVDVFKDTIERNARFEFDQELADNCIGCLQTRPNVKLQKLCEDRLLNNCTTCYCRPLWCVDCLAKWFAFRQDSERRDSWLSSKCTCPMCRATFCVLDVCYLDIENVE